MSKSSKTQSILKDKVVTTEGTEECLPCKAKNEGLPPGQKVKTIEQSPAGECIPCQAKNPSIWKVSVHNNDIFSNDTEKNLKLIGDALEQFAKFTGPQIQAIFTSMGILPSEWHPVYSGDDSTAIQIHNALAVAGLTPRIEASLKKF